MDKIYSRKRIHIPNVIYGKFNNGYEPKNKDKILKIMLIIFIAIMFANTIIKAINPIIKITKADMPHTANVNKVGISLYNIILLIKLM